jgi:hypothetical protein
MIRIYFIHRFSYTDNALLFVLIWPGVVCGFHSRSDVPLQIHHMLDTIQIVVLTSSYNVTSRRYAPQTQFCNEQYTVSFLKLAVIDWYLSTCTCGPFSVMYRSICEIVGLDENVHLLVCISHYYRREPECLGACTNQLDSPVTLIRRASPTTHD